MFIHPPPPPDAARLIPSIPKHTGIIVLLILMLHQLAQLTERLRAFTTTIRKVRNSTIRPIVSQEGSPIHEPLHATFAPSKIVDLTASIVLPETTRAKPAFHVLDSVCAGTKSWGIDRIT